MAMTSARSLSESRLAHPSSALSGPSWGLKPDAMASASISVDLPEPFSPTMNVTPGAGAKRARSCTGGTNGYSCGGGPFAESTRAASTYGPGPNGL
jgi:hypothetical protein